MLHTGVFTFYYPHKLLQQGMILKIKHSHNSLYQISLTLLLKFRLISFPLVN
jgi:hypothetical protein